MEFQLGRRKKVEVVETEQQKQQRIRNQRVDNKVKFLNQQFERLEERNQAYEASLKHGESGVILTLSIVPNKFT